MFDGLDYLQDTVHSAQDTYEDLKEELSDTLDSIDFEGLRKDLEQKIGLGTTSKLEVIQEEVLVGDYHCWGSDNAQIWRPNHTDQFPLISFAHGLFDGGEDIHAYDSMLTDLA